MKFQEIEKNNPLKWEILSVLEDLRKESVMGVNDYPGNSQIKGILRDNEDKS